MNNVRGYGMDDVLTPQGKEWLDGVISRVAEKTIFRDGPRPLDKEVHERILSLEITDKPHPSGLLND